MAAPNQSMHAVTGAFGYSGKYIARRLLANGRTVITLTNSLDRGNEFGGHVKAFPFNFDQPEQLAQSLAGVEVLYNTYWVRFNHKLFKHADAVQNTLTLFTAAKRAGVKRVVHVSITNPSESSRLEYFSGKAKLERALIESGMSYAILRPTVLFGKEDILINNIAWALRHLPAFAVFGDGQYKIQPIYVDELAQ
ncbi:MAG: NAD(P)H-binding protein [Chloroflexota bacterium]